MSLLSRHSTLAFVGLFFQPLGNVGVKTKNEKKKSKTKSAPDDLSGWDISNVSVLEAASQEFSLLALLEATSEVQCNIAGQIEGAKLSVLQTDQQHDFQDQTFDVQFSVQFVLHRI